MLADYIINLFNLQDHGYAWGLLAVLAIFYFGTTWLLEKSPASQWFNASEEVVPPFLALPAIMFALFVSALATDIWQKHYDARQALIRETSALRSIVLLTPNLGEQGSALENSVVNYIDAVMDLEWQSMTTGDHSNRENALFELESLDATIVKIADDSNRSHYVALRLNEALEKLRESRQQRISLAHDAVSSSKWASPISLAVLTLVTVAMVHMRRPRAMRISMVLTILCVIATMQLLSLNRSPYVGTAAVSKSMLYDVKKLIDDIKR